MLTASDYRYLDSLDAGVTVRTGTGTSITPLLRDGAVVTYRVYDGVHECFVKDRDEAIATSKRRKYLNVRR